jgi:diguanylate cyclase (GGDEF)-like protein/PAS domain S-box-containing protein
MLRCLLGTGTESTPGARAQEAARLVSQFVGDLCVVALASADRRRFGPFAVESADAGMSAMMRDALEHSDRERGAWPLAGRALATGTPVVIDNIQAGELEGIVNPAMDGYLGRFGLSAAAFIPMRAADGGVTGIVAMGRGPGRPSYTAEELEAVQVIADGAAEEGGPGLLTLLLRRDDLERGLRSAERRFRTLVERLPAVVYEAEPGAEGRWLYVSGFVETLLGFTQQEWYDDPRIWARCVHDEDRQAVIAAEDRLRAGERVAIEYRMHARDGSVVWVRDECNCVVGEDGRQLVEGLLTDITDRKGAEARLQHLADHDGLTGLLNRRRFIEELELELAAARRGLRSSAALVIDVDGFKFVNDSLGHQAGDELIRSVARTLADRLRGSDAIARLGGDEFACLLRGTSVQEADAVAAELLDTLREQRFTAGGETVRVTASAGIAPLDADERPTAESVLSAADLAMYEAKRAGRDRAVPFSPDLREEIARGRSWVALLRAALAESGFELLAQPVLDLRTRSVTMHELLLRLRDEEGRLAGPDSFMGVAERFGLAEAIDRWVLREAVRLLSEHEGLRLAVNLCARSIGDGAVEVLREALGSRGVDPGRLTVEVDESAAIADLERARTFALGVRGLGCTIALDDFGAGLGSFSSLKRLPIDYLKIDGEFVGGVARNPVDREMVRAIVLLARAVGRRTIAELVPDADTLELLATDGVDYAQGFHIGHPRPISELP